jgi:hypothetical protein
MKKFLAILTILVVTSIPAAQLGVMWDTTTRVVSPTNLNLVTPSLNGSTINMTNSLFTTNLVTFVQGVASYVSTNHAGGTNIVTNDFSALASYFTLTNATGRNTNLVNVYPYDIATAGSANFGGTGTQTEQSFIQAGSVYRIRQSGTIQQVYFYLGATNGISDFYVHVWRQNPTGTFDLVGSSADLWPGIIAGFNTSTVSIPNVAIGDFIGGRIVWSSAGASALNLTAVGRTATIYSSFDTTPAVTNYNWLAQTASASSAIPIEVRMQAPVGVAFGDSEISGGYENSSFIDTTFTNQTQIKTIPYKLTKAFGWDFPNMGIASQTTANLLARFTNDVINLHPKVAVIEGGINDALTGVPLATATNNMMVMMQSAVDNGITPVALLLGPAILPNGSTAFHQYMQSLNNAVSNQVIALGGIVLDGYPIVGQPRPNIANPNYWDLRQEVSGTPYDLHFNELGNTLIVNGLVDKIFTHYSILYTLAGLKTGTLQVDGNIFFPGGENRIISVSPEPRKLDGTGANLELFAGASPLAQSNTVGGNVVISSGTSLGSQASTINFNTPTPGSSGLGQNLAAQKAGVNSYGLTANVFATQANTNTYIGKSVLGTGLDMVDNGYWFGTFNYAGIALSGTNGYFIAATNLSHIGSAAPAGGITLAHGGVGLRVVDGNNLSNSILQAKIIQVNDSITATNGIFTGGMVSPTGLGITNISGVISNNIVAGANVTITAGASGQLSIASTGGAGDNWVADGTTNSTLLGAFSAYDGSVSNNFRLLKTSIYPPPEVAPTNGLEIMNLVAAAGVSNDAWSPGLFYHGNYWNGAESRSVRARTYLITSSGSPSGTLNLAYSINGGAYGTTFGAGYTFDSDGFFTAPFVTATQSLGSSGDIDAGDDVGLVGDLAWTSRSLIRSPSNGLLTLYNFAANDFNRLQFGGTSASFPSIQRSGTGLIVRLADDSANTSLTASDLVATGTILLNGTNIVAPVKKISFTIVNPVAGLQQWTYVPPGDGFTINQATLSGDAAGSIVLDVWVDTYANYPPTVADTITASAKPTLSTANKSKDVTLTGWTLAIPSDSYVKINVDSASGLTNSVLTLSGY